MMETGASQRNKYPYPKLILKAIAKIKRLRKCPSSEKICHLLRKHSDKATVKYHLQKAVENGSILPVVTGKSRKISYLDPNEVSQLTKTDLYITPTRNLMKIVVHCIQTHREANGCTLDTIEHIIRTQYRARVPKKVNLSSMLKSQVKQALRDGLLWQEGNFFKVAVTSSHKRKANPHSRRKKSRAATVDEEDTEARPSKACPPSERNQPTRKSNSRSTRCSSRTRETVNYAESSEKDEESSSSSSDTVATESSDSDQQDSDGSESNSEDEERSEKAATPSQSSEEEDENGLFKTRIKRTIKDGYSIQARKHPNASDSGVSETGYEHHRHTKRDGASRKKTALENPVDSAVPSTSYALEESAAQHERESSCRPASKIRLSDSDHQRPPTSQTMESMGTKCDSDFRTPPIGQTQSDTSVERLEADSLCARTGPSGAPSPSRSDDCDAQPLQHGRDSSAASGATTASSRKRPADLSTTFGNGTARGRVENESHSALYSEYLSSKIRKNNLTIDKLQKEREFWEERIRIEKEKEEREKKKEEREEEREKKQHALIIEKTHREIKVIKARSKREQEKAEQEKERQRRMEEMWRREADESRVRQKWYLSERNSQH